MKTYRINNKTYSSLPDPCMNCSPMTEEKFINMGGIIEDDGQPTPFEVACTQFRTVCAMMGEFLHQPDFKGGFDEYINFATSPEYAANPVMGNSLAIQWSGTNEYCKYEGSKIGLGQPEWWYVCWGLTPPVNSPANTEVVESAEEADVEGSTTSETPVEESNESNDSEVNEEENSDSSPDDNTESNEGE
jgi:hypothetical protein